MPEQQRAQLEAEHQARLRMQQKGTGSQAPSSGGAAQSSGGAAQSSGGATQSAEAINRAKGLKSSNRN